MKKDSQGSFYKRIYELVSQIPEGKVATYGQLAAMAGSPLASRAVGQAVKNTPPYLDIPCHRVVNKSGDMAPGYVFGGKEKQRLLLKKEGVVFLKDGRINMKESLWRINL